jgi:mRNA interferase MazF
LKRGDLVTTAMSGDYGKPRPAIVVQTDAVGFTETVLICLITSDLTSPGPFRVDVPCNAQTGLLRPSQIMADKTFAPPRTKCGPTFGQVDDDVLVKLGTALAFIMGI